MHVIFLHLPTDNGQGNNVDSARQGQLNFQHTKYALVTSDVYLHRRTSVSSVMPRARLREKVQPSRTVSNSNQCQ